MATALLVSQAAPEPRSWVGRVRVVGAADVIDALGAWRVSGSPDFHRDSIEAGSFGSRPRTISAEAGRPSAGGRIEARHRVGVAADSAGVGARHQRGAREAVDPAADRATLAVGRDVGDLLPHEE